MKLEALYDRGGTILAGIAFSDDDVPHPRPIAMTEDTATGEFPVPEDLADLPLDVLRQRVRVDVERGELVRVDSAKDSRKN